MSTESTETLNKAFLTVGKKYGYENVTADYSAFKDFKVQWQRSYKWANFRVSDYLMGADEKIMEGLAETLFSRITGHEETPYDENMRDWVLNPEFSEKKRPVYLNRSRCYSQDSAGERIDLNDSMQRLQDCGLVEDSNTIKLVWSTDSKLHSAGTCSVLMRVIAINDALDDANLPSFVVDYVVYCMYLRIKHGAANFGKSKEIFTRNDERKFQEYKAAEGLLDKMCLHL